MSERRSRAPYVSAALTPPLAMFGGHLIRQAEPLHWGPAIWAIVMFAVLAFVFGWVMRGDHV